MPFPPPRLGTALGVRSLQRVPRWRRERGGYVGKWANRGAGHGAGALGREGYANVVDILGPPELKGANPGAAAAAAGLGTAGAPPCSRRSPRERRLPPARGGGAAGPGSTDNPYP